jgi:predicted transcriptional regulator
VAERDPEAVRRFVEQFASAMEASGLPRMPARVFAALLASDSGRMTAAELAETLQVSPAAISGAVRYLTQINMVVREPVPGSRRDRYRLADDSWYEVTISKMILIKTIVDITEQGVVAAGGRNTPAGSRIGGMRDFYIFVLDAMPELLAKWGDRKADPDTGDRRG